MCPVHWGVLGSMCASTHQTPAAPSPPSYDNQTCLQMLPKSPGGKPLLAEDPALESGVAATQCAWDSFRATGKAHSWGTWGSSMDSMCLVGPGSRLFAGVLLPQSTRLLGVAM